MLLTRETGTGKVTPDDGNCLSYAVRTSDFGHEIIITLNIGSVEELENWWFGCDDSGDGQSCTQEKRE